MRSKHMRSKHMRSKHMRSKHMRSKKCVYIINHYYLYKLNG
jgi:hypothetical protein